MSGVLAERYASDQMRKIWSREDKISLERDLWIMVMKAQSNAGFSIDKSVISEYERVKSTIDLISIDKRERVLKHDVKARIEEFNSLAGHQLIHLGMTSRDLAEDVELFQVKTSLEVIEKKGLSFLYRLGEKSLCQIDTAVVARTHNVPAQVTTLGKRFATCAQELLFSLASLEELIARLPLRGLKGPVGTGQDQIATLGSIKDLNKLEEKLAKEYGFENTLGSVGQIYPRSIDFEVVAKLLQIASAPSSMATTIRLMSGFGLVSEGFKSGQVGSSAMPHKMNARSSERINGMMVLLRGYATMAADLAGDQWNEGDVSCSVVRRVVIPDAFYTIDGLLHTFMTVLTEFGIYEENINKELAEQLPFLATSQILTELVKKGMGREVAHELIKRHATTTTASNFFNALASERDFPLSINQLNNLIKDPAAFAGSSLAQSEEVADPIKQIIKGQVSKVDLQSLI